MKAKTGAKKRKKTMAALAPRDLPLLRESLIGVGQEAKGVASRIQAVIDQLAELTRNTTELETVNKSLELTDESMKADGITALEKEELEESKKPWRARKDVAESVLTAENVGLAIKACDDATKALEEIKRKLEAIT